MMFKNNNILLLVVLLLAGCASNGAVIEASRYAEYSDPLDAVMELRKDTKMYPNDVHARSLLKQYELKAAEYYYKKGQVAYGKNDFDAAIELYGRGLTAMPEHDKLLQAMGQASARVEADKLYKEAVKNYQAGKRSDAENMLLSIVDMLPSHAPSENLLKKMNGERLAAQADHSFIDGKQKISLNFNNTNIKTAFEFLAKSFDFNLIFDEGVKDQLITLQAQDMSFKQALKLMLTTSKMFYKRIGNNTLLIAPDSKSKHEQYEELLIKTYHLRTIPAKEMADILKGVLSLKKVVVNDAMNSLMIRDNPGMHGLVEKLVEINDRRPAELLLEVEILEVNRSKAEQLGFDYGSVITAEFPVVDPAVNTLSSALSSGTITLPNVTFRYFKQDVDAETLANPKIRVINQKPAKIHIGDRVPLRSSTIQNAAGQTQTSYEYSDIGIRLDVTPIIHFDNTVTVQVNLEVSSLGQNLGTPEEPTYSIGTRNTQTHMLLRDGETAMIGGLIRDEDRANQVRVAGLGDIPIIGSLFRSNDDSLGRTDVLLTITPRVVRGWDIPQKSLLSIHSGTAERFSDDQMFVRSVAKAHEAAIQVSTQSETNPQAGQKMNSPQSQPKTAGYFLNFGKSLYESAQGKEFQAAVMLNRTDDIKEITIPVMFNRELLELIDISSVSDDIADLQKEYTDNGMMVTAQFKEDAEAKENTSLFTMTLRGQQVGISYLMVKQAARRAGDGTTGGIESRASRIVIK